MKKRTVSLITLILALFCLISCADNSNPPEETTVVTSAATETSEVTTAAPYDGLPDDLDFASETVYIVVANYNNAYYNDLYAAEQTGDQFNDSIYKTISQVQDRLNVKLDYRNESFVWSGLNAFTSKIEASILANDDKMDLIIGASSFTGSLSKGGLFENLTKNKYVDLTRSYYNQSVSDSIVGNYVPFACGDFSIGNLKNAYAIFGNSDIYASLGRTENVYQAVWDGTWTIESLSTMIADVYADLDGSATANENDRYGLTFGDFNKYVGFFHSCGNLMLTKNDGDFSFSMEDERAVDTMSVLRSLICDNPNALRQTKTNKADGVTMIDSGDGNCASKQFLDGNALLSCSLICDAKKICSDITFPYFLLPYPKLNENQENYRISLQRCCYALIPTSAASSDRSGAVLEALASEYSREVLPIYCEVYLKARYSIDSDVARVFDLINQSIVFDAGLIYSDALNTPSTTIRTYITSANVSGWTSSVTALKRPINKSMNELTDFVKSLE